MTLSGLLARIRELDIVLERNGDLLRVDAPPGAVTEALRAELIVHKAEILTLIDAGEEPSLDVLHPYFVDIALLWRDRALKKRDRTLDLPGLSA